MSSQSIQTRTIYPDLEVDCIIRFRFFCAIYPTIQELAFVFVEEQNSLAVQMGTIKTPAVRLFIKWVVRSLYRYGSELSLEEISQI